jgi:uncharacterized RDD family membrane protein YckC
MGNQRLVRVSEIPATEPTLAGIAMRFMKGLTTALLIIGTLFVLPVILIVQLPYLSLMALGLALVVLLWPCSGSQVTPYLIIAGERGTIGYFDHRHRV